MKKKHLATAAIATAFCAATMTSCGVYGAQEPPIDQTTSSTTTVDEPKPDDNKDKTTVTTTEYDPTTEEPSAVYGAEEDYE